jgi:hypothetical protein
MRCAPGAILQWTEAKGQVAEEQKLSSNIPQWLQDLDTVLGLVGFIITVALMFQVRTIKRSFLSRARLPVLIKDLEKAGTTLNGHLANWPQRKNHARTQIKIAATLVRSAAQLLPAGDRKSIEETHLKLDVSAKTFGDVRFDDPDVAWDLYSDIQSTISTLTQSARNLNWE